MTLDVRLSDPSVDFWVDVKLRSFDDRWLAVADIAGQPEVGIGSSARRALVAALSGLGERLATALLADPQLLATSVEAAAKTVRDTN